jgi:hypothetical protein
MPSRRNTAIADTVIRGNPARKYRFSRSAQSRLKIDINLIVSR